MRSVRTVSGTLLATLPVAVLLSGCVTTQRVATRARLADSRILAGQSPTEISRSNPAVRIGRPVLIRARGGTAIAIALTNDSSTTLTDLPISVGTVTSRGRRLYLNRSATLDYFASHVASIGPHATVTWAFTTTQRLAGRARPFATVGFSQLHPPAPAPLPRIDVTVHRSVSVAGGLALELSIANRSAIPQYDLPVYAVAVSAGRDVAVGSATVVHLGTHGRTTVSLTLVGSTRQATLELSALPTIFS